MLRMDQFVRTKETRAVGRLNDVPEAKDLPMKLEIFTGKVPEGFHRAVISRHDNGRVDFVEYKNRSIHPVTVVLYNDSEDI